MYMNDINGIVSKSPNLNVPILASPSVELNTPTPFQHDASWFSGKNLITLGLLIVILALLGMNIFAYFAEGVDILGILLQRLGLDTVNTIEKTVDVSKDGVKLGADIAAGTVKDAADIIKPAIGGKTRKRNNIADAVNDMGNDSDYSDDNDNSNSVNDTSTSNINEDQSLDSEIQSRSSSQKAGWCYIGTDRNVRSCLQVGKYDKCMSGDIFPSREICMNPNLRS